MSVVEALKVAMALMDALIAYIEPMGMHGSQADELPDGILHSLCGPIRKRVIELRQARTVLAGQRAALQADEIRKSVEQQRKGVLHDPGAQDQRAHEASHP